MDFLEKLLNLIGFNRAEEAEEVGTTQPPLYSEEDRQLQYQLGDTEMLADMLTKALAKSELATARAKTMSKEIL